MKSGLLPARDVAIHIGAALVQDETHPDRHGGAGGNPTQPNWGRLIDYERGRQSSNKASATPSF